jgi:DNA-binding Lrp family transcriptional regulator
MKGIAVCGDKRMTVREVAEALGCHSETIKQHVRKLFPQLMEKGKETYLNEAQVTIVLESVKTPVSSGTVANLQSQIVGVETAQSRALRIDLLHRQIEAEMQAEIAEQKARAEAAEERLSIAQPKAETLDKITATSR